MIQHADIHQRQGIGQTAGELHIRAAGLGNAGWMVMGEDDGRRVVIEGALDDFPRMYAGTIDGATEQLLVADDPVAVIEKQAGDAAGWRGNGV